MEKFTVLQDLARSQNDQLLNIRRLIDETMFRNDLLLDELEKLRLETYPRAAQDLQGQIPVHPPEQLMPSIEHSKSKEETVSEEHNIATDLRYESGRGLNLPLMSPEQHGSRATRGEIGRDRLTPFCSREGPWKYLKSARKALKGTVTLLLAGDELTFDDERHTTGILIKPQHIFNVDSNGAYKKSEYNKGKWIKIPIRCHQIIWRSGASFVYLGTYETSFSKILNTTEFHALSAKVKNEIYLVTSSSTKKIKRDLEIPALYEGGELSVLQMECRRIGFDTAFQEALFEAAGLPVPGDTSTEPDLYYDAPSSDRHNSLTSENPRIPSPNETPSPDISTQSNNAVSGLGFRRTYSLIRSPKKELKNAKKTGAIRNLKGAIKVKNDEFIVGTHGTQPGFEIVPLQKMVGSRKKGYTLKPQNLDKYTSKARDIIVCCGSQYVYLGKLTVKMSRILEAEEYQRLTPEVRKRVCAMTFNSNWKEEDELRYASGELKVARLDFECVGSNEDVERVLEGLAARGF